VGAIGDVQKLFEFAPDGSLFNPDGLIGSKTFDLVMNKLVTCLDPEPPPANATVLTQDGTHTVRVWVESLPQVEGGDARAIFDSCWLKWQQECDLEYLPATSAANADVVVSVGNVDGRPGAKLAEAHVGPPHKFRRQLTMTIDALEEFAATPGRPSSQAGRTKPVFAAMCIHEIGHLLGLSHHLHGGGTAALGTVMYPIHQPTITELHDDDKDRITGIWGEPNVF
jgi:predicted Zn-dependent protease